MVKTTAATGQMKKVARRTSHHVLRTCSRAEPSTSAFPSTLCATTTTTVRTARTSKTASHPSASGTNSSAPTAGASAINGSAMARTIAAMAPTRRPAK